ncbi:cytochrome b [Denitratimonas tolerans]|uniref:Cytochrome b n=1 Tax=Denitratimonas tolerans TaxID=1338420 RepID=A0AAW9QX57_9GAMM|nr:cytochrome b [Xanthomonadaceae bacterium]
MSLRNTNDRWAWPSMTLHWLIALLILALLGVGFVMVELPRSPRYFWVYDLHKSIGLTVLVLMLIRLGWRIYAGAPKPVPGTPPWQHVMAQAVHLAIYFVALAMPISGWLYDSASGLRALKFFGWFTVPKLVAPDPGIKSVAHEFHEWGAWVLIALILMHAGAALVHHWVQRDRTLWRMLPASFEKTR